ncbi:hypothetical protein GIB67_016305 [Kingdonia uniflora]|uniref:Uncharacterized protein n=1 Tax=Kingdonia uniflora TaxID=39325 RepID=A0A7J7M9D9_9MAGN|nr:hypothetical protein GIB67_016305 [Kingdonia uniflora]
MPIVSIKSATLKFIKYNHIKVHMKISSLILQYTKIDKFNSSPFGIYVAKPI